MGNGGLTAAYNRAVPPAPDAQRKLSAEHLIADLLGWLRTLGGRLMRAFRRLPHDRQLAALASVGLLVVLFLPWYQETIVIPGAGAATEASTSITGWGNFSLVEAAVLLVGVGVLMLLFQRAEGRAFHLPGGDGWVIMVAGGWSCVLMVWQIFDKPTASIHGPGATISGIEWGIFAALAVSGLLTYTGSRIRGAHRPEPPLPGENHPPAPVGTLLGEPDGEGPLEPAPDPQAPTVARRRHGEATARPRGWLTAPPQRPEQGSEQLTIPLEAEE